MTDQTQKILNFARITHCTQGIDIKNLNAHYKMEFANVGVLFGKVGPNGTTHTWDKL